MQPSSESTTLDDLVGSVRKGVLFTGLGASFDFQKRSGAAVGTAYAINNGKKIARLDGAGLLFQSTELWKSLIAIGGAASARQCVGRERKGEPQQSSVHSVTAVPAIVKQQAVIDIRRKA
jgi:predicted Zn-dependent protease